MAERDGGRAARSWWSCPRAWTRAGRVLRHRRAGGLAVARVPRASWPRARPRWSWAPPGRSGLIAVQAARLLGAGRVVGAARNADRLKRAEELGADATVVLGSDDDAGALAEACGGDGPDVVVDPCGASPAWRRSRPRHAHARIVQIGQSAGRRGHRRLGHHARQGPVDPRLHQLPGRASRTARRPTGAWPSTPRAASSTCDVEEIPLDDVAQAWERQGSGPYAKLAIIP